MRAIMREKHSPGGNDRTRSQTCIAKEALLPVTGGKYPRRISFSKHNKLYSSLGLNSPTPVPKVQIIEQVIMAFTSYSLAGLKTEDLLQHNRGTSIYLCSYFITVTGHALVVPLHVALPENQCHGIFPIKQNNTFIKPQAWLSQGYAHGHNGT